MDCSDDAAIPPSEVKPPFPRHLFVPAPSASATLPMNRAVVIATAGLDYEQPIIPQVQHRLYALQAPTEYNPRPTPVSELMSQLDLLEGILQANRAAAVHLYRTELQTAYKGITRLTQDLEKANRRVEQLENRVEKVEGLLYRLLNGISSSIVAAWTLPVSETTYMKF